MMGFASNYKNGLYELRSTLSSFSYLFDKMGVPVAGLYSRASYSSKDYGGGTPIDLREKTYEISFLLDTLPNEDYIKNGVRILRLIPWNYRSNSTLKLFPETRSAKLISSSTRGNYYEPEI